MPEIGETLRDARMRARIDITEVEAVTKIRAKYLRALENEEWQLLPGPTFVKTFLRTYAEYLGLDAKLLVEEYKLRHEGVSDLDLAPIAPPGMRPAGMRPASGGRGQRQSRGGRRPQSQRGRQRSQRQGPRISRGLVVGVAVAGVLILLLVIGLVSKDPSDQAATTAPTTTAAPRTTTTPRTTATTAPAPPTRVALVVNPTADVYVCIRDAADKLVLSDTLTPDSKRRTFRSKSLKVTVGNSSVVLSVNGKDVKVKPSADPTTYQLTPRRTKVLPTAANAC
jgi:cytoskeleton protein RodZ